MGEAKRKNNPEVVMILKDFINRCYPEGLRHCKKEDLPQDIIKSLSLIKPILLDWEKQGYIKISQSNECLFEILKEIPD